MTDNPTTEARLCLRSEIGPSGKEVRVDRPEGPMWLMLFDRDGEISAWRNVCPHQGRALNWA
ncbi:MAG: Rieske (2Fe-2S) protein, partial [Xanthomonadales bacterium]|nr:Rieske (2Fe-2S) protein [Xanthomonadales bacterium]